MAAIPTVTIREVSDATQDSTLSVSSKKVVEGLLNDYMDLQYAKETPFTTGQQVVPSRSTIEDVDNAIDDENVSEKFKEVFKLISATAKSGDLTPITKNDGTWDPKLKPVLVVVTPNP